MNLDIEKDIEDATALIMADIPSITIFQGFDDSQLLTPRLEIQADGVSFLDTLDIFPSTPNAILEYGKFDMEIQLRVVTSLSEGHTRTLHYDFVNQVRNKFLRSADNFTPSNLPLINISYIKMVASAQAINGENRTTESTYSIQGALVTN